MHASSVCGRRREGETDERRRGKEVRRSGSKESRVQLVGGGGSAIRERGRGTHESEREGARRNSGACRSHGPRDSRLSTRAAAPCRTNFNGGCSRLRRLQCCVVRRHGRPLGAFARRADLWYRDGTRTSRIIGGTIPRAVLCVCGSGSGSNSDSPFVVATSACPREPGASSIVQPCEHAARPRCAVATTPLCEQRTRSVHPRRATRSEQGKFRPAAAREVRRWRPWRLARYRRSRLGSRRPERVSRLARYRTCLRASRLILRSDSFPRLGVTAVRSLIRWRRGPCFGRRL